MKKISILAAASALAFALTGCGSDSDGSSPAANEAAESQLSIVATTTQVADFVRNIVPEGWEITQLLEPGASAHSFEPTAAELLELANADVLIENGAGLEEWLDDATEAAGFKGTVIDASEGVELGGTHEHEDEEEGDDHEHADEADEHADEADDHADEADDHADEADDHADEADDHADEADESDEHDHDHGEYNPHIWMDPHNARIMVTNIAEGLAALDSANAETFTSNAEAYNAKLESLDSWITEAIDQVPESERLLVSNHDAFYYFTERYHVTFVGSIIPNFEDNAEPSAAQLEELVNEIKKLKVKAIFSETAIDPSTAEQIANSAGVEVYSGEDALYADSLGAADSDGATYISSMIHNTTKFLSSWGHDAPEVPAELKS